jgi:hypothetical protein
MSVEAAPQSPRFQARADACSWTESRTGIRLWYDETSRENVTLTKQAGRPKCFTDVKTSIAQRSRLSTASGGRGRSMTFTR